MGGRGEWGTLLEASPMYSTGMCGNKVNLISDLFLLQYQLGHREISQLDHRENKAYTLVTKETTSVHSNRYENE